MKTFLFGALLGAGVALLYAPATGRRTRAMIRDKATKMEHDVTDFVGKKKRHLSNKMEGYKAKMRHMTEAKNDGRMASLEREIAEMSEPAI